MRIRIARLTSITCIILIGATMTTTAWADSADPMMQTMREDAQSTSAVIYNALAKTAPDNFVVAPYTIQMALGMLYAGSSGVTAEQIASALHWRLPPAAFPGAHHHLEAQMQSLIRAEGVQWINASHLWLKEGTEVRDAYRDTLTKYFDAGVDTSGFKPDAIKTLNDWVGTKTQNMLHDLVTPDMLSPPPALVELAVSYFKANWETPCKRAGERTFFSKAGASKEVPMVRCDPKRRTLPVVDTTALTAVELPYVHDTLRMLIVMPKTDLAVFERKLRANTVMDIIASMHDEHVEVTFPSFEITTPFPLKKALQDLNIRDLFSERANLGGIAKTPLKVDAFVEQARIKVDEHGTEAAAAVVATAQPLAILMPEHKITIDHPFMFVIQNRASGVPLYMGRVTSL